MTVNQFVGGSIPSWGAKWRGGRVVEGSGLLIRRTERFPGFESLSLCQLRVLCNGKTLAFQANDRSSILLTRSIQQQVTMKGYNKWEESLLRKQWMLQVLTELT